MAVVATVEAVKVVEAGVTVARMVGRREVVKMVVAERGEARAVLAVV